MKFHFNMPLSDNLYRLGQERYRQTNWNKTAIDVLTAVLSVTLYVGGFAIWPVKPDVKEVLASPLLHVFLFVAIGIATLIVHEVLHLAFSPGGLTDMKNAMGIVPKKFMCYAYSPHAAGWVRTLVMLFAPLTILTVVPCLIQATVGLPTGWLGFMAIANASFAANDIIIGLYILLCVPREAADVQPNVNGVTYAL